MYGYELDVPMFLIVTVLIVLFLAIVMIKGAKQPPVPTPYSWDKIYDREKMEKDTTGFSSPS